MENQTETQDRLKGLIEYVLGHLVTKPDEVHIDLTENRRRMVYQVRVAAEDVGVVIGRAGRTINAIRALLKAVPGAPARVWLELIDERDRDEASREGEQREAEPFDDGEEQGFEDDDEEGDGDYRDEDRPQGPDSDDRFDRESPDAPPHQQDDGPRHADDREARHHEGAESDEGR